MKQIAIVFSLLVSITLALESDMRTFPWANGNKCAECIVGGNQFCVLGVENQTIPEEMLEPQSVCCRPTDIRCN